MRTPDTSKSIPTPPPESKRHSFPTDGEPTLAATYALLGDKWRSGHRDRETALHLAFLAWYILLEPAHITGASDSLPVNELRSMFDQAHDYLLPRAADSDDAEALYTIGVMTHIWPYAFENHADWVARSLSYRVRYRQLTPQGLSPSIFEGRGAYGEYFHSQASVKNGY